MEPEQSITEQPNQWQPILERSCKGTLHSRGSLAVFCTYRQFPVFPQTWETILNLAPGLDRAHNWSTAPKTEIRIQKKEGIF